MIKALSQYIKKPPKTFIIIACVTILILVGIFITLYFTVGKDLTEFISDKESFKAWLESYKEYGAVIFVLIRTLQTIVKFFPAEPLEIASGYVFGVVGGTALCSLGSFLGTVIILSLTKLLGKKFTDKFINKEKFENLEIINNAKNQRLFLVIFYLIPATPKDTLTYIFGLLNMNIGEFLIITTICRIPSIISSTIVGSQIEQGNYTVAIIIFGIITAFSLICSIWYKRKNKEHQ